MLAKRNRLVSPQDFKNVLKNGKMYHGAYFTFAALKADIKTTKIGIICSNKISKLATERNLIRRAARFGAYKSFNQLPPGILGVFLVKKEAVEVPFKSLWQDAAGVLEKVK